MKQVSKNFHKIMPIYRTLLIMYKGAGSLTSGQTKSVIKKDPGKEDKCVQGSRYSWCQRFCAQLWLFCFEIFTLEGRGGKECKFENKAHRTLDIINTSTPVHEEGLKNSKHSWTDVIRVWSPSYASNSHGRQTIYSTRRLRSAFQCRSTVDDRRSDGGQSILSD